MTNRCRPGGARRPGWRTTRRRRRRRDDEEGGMGLRGYRAPGETTSPQGLGALPPTGASNSRSAVGGWLKLLFEALGLALKLFDRQVPQLVLGGQRLFQEALIGVDAPDQGPL